MSRDVDDYLIMFVPCVFIFILCLGSVQNHCGSDTVGKLLWYTSIFLFISSVILSLLTITNFMKLDKWFLLGLFVISFTLNYIGGWFIEL